MPEIQLPWLVSSLPASPTHRRVALAVSIILLVAFVIAVPSARVMLPRLEIYIPLVATVMFVNDLTTASLLLAQFSIVRSRTLLLLANGYLFAALVVAVYGLIWPGAFHPTGLFGAGPQTGPWLYLVWHAGLPTSVIVYALLESKEHKMPFVAQGSVRAFIFASTTCTVLIVCGLTWFVTRFQDVLPNLVTSLDRSTAASLAHEITQPIAAARNNARAALNFLDKQPPALGKVRKALGGVLADADRAGDIIDRIRDHVKKVPPRKHRIDIEQKAAGMIPMYTDLKNPDFGEVAKAMGLWGRSVVKAGDLEESIKTWLAHPGPALLDVKVNPMQLVMPPSPFMAPEAVIGMGVYTAKAVLEGKGRDVWEMIVENVP
jgi:hypothetical protein